MAGSPDARKCDSLTFVFGLIDDIQTVVMRVETKQGEPVEIGMSGEGLVALRNQIDRFLARHTQVRQ